MLSKCCCCIDLRTGSLILAILGILGSILTFATSDGDWPLIMQGTFNLLAYSFLLFGALKCNEKAVLACLICTGFAIAWGIIFTIIVFVSIALFKPELDNNCEDIIEQLKKLGTSCDQLKHITMGIAAGSFIAGSLINIYFWICNYSFYKELKKGRNGISNVGNHFCSSEM